MINLLPKFKGMMADKESQKISGKMCKQSTRQRCIGVMIVLAVTFLMLGIAKHWELIW